MREKLARAGWDANVDEIGDWDTTVKVLGRNHVEIMDWFKVVDALLAALMEPDEVMLSAACVTPGMRAVENAFLDAHIHGRGLPEFEPAPLVQAWQAMLREAGK